MTTIQNGTKKKSRRQIYIALEELDFIWDVSEITLIESMWNNGMSLDSIAKEMQRDQDEAALLIMDRARRNAIRPRKEGIHGKKVIL